MTSTTETGHAKNVANFETLTTTATNLEEAYNPSKETLKLSALELLFTESKATLNAVNIAQADYSNNVSARKSSFKTFGKLITRVYNALKATDTTTQIDESAKTIVRKLQGRRASTKLSAEDIKLLAEDGKEINQISASQMSFDSRIENFDKLIMLLSSVPLYKPNEVDLKIETLTALYNELKTKNTNVILTYVKRSNARIARNEKLYKENIGLVDIAFDTKTYIKSIFGATSPQYKQISKLKFTKPKR